MRRRGLHHEHARRRAPSRCEGGGGPPTGARGGPLPPLLPRGARPIPAERCAPSAWRPALLARAFPPPRAPMEPLGGVAPWGHFGAPEGRPEMSAVRLPLHGEAARLVRPNRRCPTPAGVRGSAFGARAGRPRRAGRGTAGRQEALAGSLHHPSTAGRAREEAGTVAARLRDRRLSPPHGAIRAGDPCRPSLLEQRVEPAGLQGGHGDAGHSRRAGSGLGQWRGFVQDCRGAERARQAPATPGRCSRRLGVSPPTPVWQLPGGLGPRTPAAQVVAGRTRRRGPSLHGPSPAAPRRRPPPAPSRLQGMSRWTGSTPSRAAAAGAAGRGGALQVLRVALAPCGRSHPAGVVRRVRPSATAHAACAGPVAGSASGAPHGRGHRCVRWRDGLETRPHPAAEAVERLQQVAFPSPCSPRSRALAFPLGGFSPTAHASLRWTHNRACQFPGIPLKPLAGRVQAPSAVLPPAGGTLRHRSRCPGGAGSPSGTKPPPCATPAVAMPPWCSSRDTAGTSARVRAGGWGHPSPSQDRTACAFPPQGRCTPPEDGPRGGKRRGSQASPPSGAPSCSPPGPSTPCTHGRGAPGAGPRTSGRPQRSPAPSAARASACLCGPGASSPGRERGPGR
jgi:hypothetical protein